nr:immunoglobulin light chain junction region [Macaca mulatta]
CQQESDWPTF